jgi:hypothetical protein
MIYTDFSTAHSLTTERKDALFTLKVNDIVGYGEVGLPPKKPFCYKADYNDIVQYYTFYAAKVSLPLLHLAFLLINDGYLQRVLFLHHFLLSSNLF